MLQLNAGRGRKVNTEVRDQVDKNRIDLLLIQEPYTYKGKIHSFGERAQIITGNNCDETLWAAVVIFNKNLTVMKLGHVSYSHVVCVQIDNGNSSIYVICAYFQFSHQIEGNLTKIQEALHALREEKVIICADANAKSPLWYSEELDDRGVIL